MYRNVEKPPKFMEKGNLEVLLFTLQSKMRANNKTPYFPKEGKTIADINRAWERLEKAEHERELALREELIRQEKLEQLIFSSFFRANVFYQFSSEKMYFFGLTKIKGSGVTK